MKELRQYQSVEDLRRILDEVQRSLTAEQYEAMVVAANASPQFRQEYQRIAGLPHPLKIEDVPNDLLLSAAPLMAEAVLSALSKDELDPEKSDALHLLCEVFYCALMVKECDGDATKLSSLQRARISLANERFEQKPFSQTHIRVTYEYQSDHVPLFMDEQFKETVAKKLIEALIQDPDASLTKYEQELGVTVTGIEHPQRKTKTISGPAPKLKDVIL